MWPHKTWLWNESTKQRINCYSQQSQQPHSRTKRLATACLSRLLLIQSLDCNNDKQIFLPFYIFSQNFTILFRIINNFNSADKWRKIIHVPPLYWTSDLPYRTFRAMFTEHLQQTLLAPCDFMPLNLKSDKYTIHHLHKLNKYFIYTLKFFSSMSDTFIFLWAFPWPVLADLCQSVQTGQQRHWIDMETFF